MSFDTYEYESGRSLRITGKKVLVMGDELSKKTKGGLWKPEGACEHVYRTGTILAFGYDRIKKTGKKVPIRDIEVGLKCCFVRFLAEQDSNKQIRARFGDDDVFLIGPTDLMFVWPANAKNPPDINL